jgi:tRNA(Ile)-lysidine synthase TilS/MesJ
VENASVFEIWEERNRDYLSGFKGKKLLVAYSGGKDSAVCVHLLGRMREKYGFSLEAHLYAFPRHLYGPRYADTVTRYWESRGVSLEYHEADGGDPEIRGLPDPCRVCQGVRKKALSRIFPKLGIEPEKLVIVFGHSLWDLAGYAIEHLIDHELADPKDPGGPRNLERFLEISQRFYPCLEMKEGYSVYRPLHFLNQRNIKDLLAESETPPLDLPCEYAERRPKKVLAGYFERFGLEFSYENVMKFASKHLSIGEKAAFEGISKEEFLGKRI